MEMQAGEQDGGWRLEVEVGVDVEGRRMWVVEEQLPPGLCASCRFTIMPAKCAARRQEQDGQSRPTARKARSTAQQSSPWPASN